MSLKRLVVFTVLMGSVLVGCATQKEWIPYSGSKTMVLLSLRTNTLSLRDL
jgi:hypothetical protein